MYEDTPVSQDKFIILLSYSIFFSQWKCMVHVYKQTTHIAMSRYIIYSLAYMLYLVQSRSNVNLHLNEELRDC